MSDPYIVDVSERILITGASGFIGVRVVETLLRYGFTNLCCFVRPSSRLQRLKATIAEIREGDGVEFVAGDLLSSDDCRRAVEGVSVIYHLAAGMEKSFAGAFMNSALTTRNLMDAFLERGAPKRFVNVSSFAVYSNLKMKRGAPLDENSPLEEESQERADAYGFGKLKQEELVKEYGRIHNLPYVILRPGVVFGPGKRELSGRVGINTFGFFIHLGGANRLPLTFVDNCAEAIVLAGLVRGVDGEIFNVVDDDPLTSRAFFRAYKAKVGLSALSMPYPVTHLLCLLWERYSKWSNYQLPPVFNRRRCAAEWKGNCYPNQKLKERLGWTPRVNMRDAIRLFLAQFDQDAAVKEGSV